jgi:arylsulfatase A-like enzyme
MRALLLSVSLAALAYPAFAADTTPTRPNVLFIAIDDLKPLLSCYGASWIKSPNIDRLASRGALFTASYCQVSFCAPSRMSVLTGLRPDTTRVFFNPARQEDILRTRFPDIVTLPQQFKSHHLWHGQGV